MSTSEADATLHRPLGGEPFAARRGITERVHSSETTLSHSLTRRRLAATAIRRIDANDDDPTGEFSIHPATSIDGSLRRSGKMMPIRCTSALNRDRVAQPEHPTSAQASYGSKSRLLSYKPTALPRPPWWSVVAAVVAAAGMMWWLMSQRLPEIDPRQVIAANIAAAQLAIHDGRLIEPPERSALHYYSAVLALDPANEAAIAGLDHIAERFVEDAKRGILSGRFADAVDAIERVRRARPDHRRLPHLEAQLREALTDHVLAIKVEPSGAEVPSSRAKGRSVANSQTVVSDASAPAKKSSNEQVDHDAQVRDARGNGAVAPNEAVESGDVLDAKLVNNAPLAIQKEELTLPVHLLTQAREISVENAQISTAENELRLARDAPDTARVDAPMEPKLISVVEPNYPRAARVRNIEGWVDLNLSVTPAGKVDDAHVLRREGSKSFERAALAAVRQWQYSPIELGDPNARQSVEVRVAFRLEE